MVESDLEDVADKSDESEGASEDKDAKDDSSEIGEIATDSAGNKSQADEKEVGSGEYMTVYNNETGVYEIVSVAEYLTKDAYISENQKLGIKDLSQHVSGYAQSKVDVNQERGILMYIIPILIIFGIAAGIVIYVKRKERKA